MKKKIFALMLCIAMLAIAVVGGTLAYFTDDDDVTNTFTMGNVAISLDEAKVERPEGEDVWEATDERVKENEYEGVYPGAVLPKDPTVHNEGTYGAYVRAKVIVNFNALAGLQESGKLFANGVDDSDLTAIVNIDTENWTFEAMEFPTEDPTALIYSYRYNTELAAGADTTPLFTEVSIPGFVSNEVVTKYGLGEFQIKVIAEAIQADGFADADAAWAAFSA